MKNKISLHLFDKISLESRLSQLKHFARSYGKFRSIFQVCKNGLVIYNLECEKSKNSNYFAGTLLPSVLRVQKDT